MFDLIDHMGVVVPDLDEGIAQYAQSFSMTVSHRETMSDQGVEAALLDVGPSHVELLAPLSAENAVGRFLARRGAGLHHVAYRVDDVEAALSTLRANGVQLIDERPRGGIRGSRVAFIHPRSTGGVLTEIVQPGGH
jgi:methylmalonyl-CoA/ethylmalonyl-CoA epimerase